MGTLIMIGQLLLGLSIIVGLHELGHLLTAKLFGMRVERFSIGFPPKIFGYKWGETEYSVGALPLGGYVKISGMIDESLDTQHLQSEPQPHEFRSKPAWQRLIVMMGGILVNVFTGIIMFICIVYFLGTRYTPTSEVNKHGIYAYETAKDIGLKTGDKIIKINGKTFDNFDDVISPATLLESDSYYTVLRDGKEVRVDIPNDLIERLSYNRNNPQPFIQPLAPFLVQSVREGDFAEQAGLKAKDKIVAVNGQPIQYFHELRESLDAIADKYEEDIKESALTSAQITIEREGKKIELPVKVSQEGTIGIYIENILERKHIEYTLAEAIPLGTAKAFGSVITNIKGFGKFFKGEVSPRSISGPIGIAQVFGTRWDWARFWLIIAVLSMWLAFLNFLPIPALDGGHVMFLVFEMVSGKKPSDRFLEHAQRVGIVLLLTLMIFVIFNDIFNVFIWD